MALMIDQRKIISIPLKCFLGLAAVTFAVAATLLLIFFTTAATDTGSSPAAAISLVEGMNTGILGPDQHRWFRLALDQRPAIVELEQSLTLIFTPAHDNLTQYISLQIFTADQIQFFDPNKPGQTATFGVGQLAANENNRGQAKLFWHGWLARDQLYYIQLRNDSDFAIEYWLSNQDIKPEVVAGPETSLPAPPPAPEIGLDPGRAVTLNSDVRQGRLQPDTTYWYTFAYHDFAAEEKFRTASFSMFFTPGNDHRQQQVNFRVFSAGEIEQWQRGGQAEPLHFGAGMLVSRDGDPLTGERVWQGPVLRGDTYFLAIENKADMAIDYWLFDGDIHHAELGTQAPAQPAPAAIPEPAPQTATSLNPDRTLGRLEPGQEIWHSFSIADQDQDYFEAAALTLIATPVDEHRIQQVNLEIFTAAAIQNWSPGNDTGINNVGAGSIVYRDDNPLTGERFWSGWIVDNELYYVRLRNSADIPIDYWLFNGDVYGPELGP
jgi:hypothetical protein